MTNQQSQNAIDQEIAAAVEAFTITEDATTLNAEVHYLSATADTGWRYSICVSELPDDGIALEGGPLLVTVLSPWTAAWALQRIGYLSERYVEEHLNGHVTRSGVDIRVLTMLVRKGLGREVDR